MGGKCVVQPGEQRDFLLGWRNIYGVFFAAVRLSHRRVHAGYERAGAGSPPLVLGAAGSPQAARPMLRLSIMISSFHSRLLGPYIGPQGGAEEAPSPF